MSNLKDNLSGELLEIENFFFIFLMKTILKCFFFLNFILFHRGKFFFTNSNLNKWLDLYFNLKKRIYLLTHFEMACVQLVKMHLVFFCLRINKKQFQGSLPIFPCNKSKLTSFLSTQIFHHIIFSINFKKSPYLKIYFSAARPSNKIFIIYKDYIFNLFFSAVLNVNSAVIHKF